MIDSRFASAWRFAVLVLAATLPYLPALGYGFINFDDNASIVDLPLIRALDWQSLPKFFTPDVYAGLYEFMPLKNLSYALDYALFGPAARAFRPQQLIWYVASVLAAYWWLRLLLQRLCELGRLDLTRETAEWVALGASVLFALHPAHVESVTWLSGRKDVLSGTFLGAALGCGLVYTLRSTRDVRLRAWPYCAASLGCLGLGLLSKPTATAIAPLLLVQEFWVFQRSTVGPRVEANTAVPGGFARIRSAASALRNESWAARAWLHVPAWLMTLGFALMYSRIVDPFTHSSLGEVPGLRARPVLRVAEQLARYLQLVVDPSRLVPIVPPLRFSPDYLSTVACAGYVVSTTLAATIVLGFRRRRPLALAALLFVVPLLPSLVRPVWGQYVAGRYLYYALLGPVLALAWAWGRTFERHDRLRLLLTAASAAVALVWISATLSYSSAFRSSKELWDYAIGVDPEYTKYYDLAARAALLDRDPERAIARLQTCLKIDPKSVECAAPLGGLLLPIDPEKGEALLRQVLPYDVVGTAHIRLAQHWSQHGRTREALALYESWLHGRGTDPNQLGVLVDLAIADNQLEKARRYLRQQIAAASVLQPASPPPTAAVVSAAERAGDQQLAASARIAADRCNRSDCFAQALGVRP